NLLATNLVLIASVADIFSFEVGKTCCCCGFGRAVFWLFGNTDIDISASRAIGVDCVEKADPLVLFQKQRHGSSSSSEDRSGCFPLDAAPVIFPWRMQTTKAVRMRIL